MSFMKEILQTNIPIWDKCIRSPFVQKLRDGTLPQESFKEYIIQDSIYLKNYARVYGQAIFCASNLKDIKTYYNMLSFVSDSESEMRIKYLKLFGITDDEIEFIKPYNENQKYIDFLMEISARGNELEILMAVLPCMLSYSYIFRKILSDSIKSNSKYIDFISDYSSDSYAESCKKWCDYTDEKCNRLSDKDKLFLSEIFEQASLLELDFWHMSYKNGEV